MADLKSRSKAMKIDVGVSGVAITGPEKNQVEVVEEGIDVVVLMKLIKKNVAYAEIVREGEAKKEEAADEKPPPVVWSFAPAPAPAPAPATAPPAPPPPPSSYSYYDGYWNYD